MLLHTCMLLRVALAADTFGVIACGEYVVEVALCAMMLSWWRVAIYRLPRFHGCEGKFVWGHSENGACVYESLHMPTIATNTLHAYHICCVQLEWIDGNVPWWSAKSAKAAIKGQLWVAATMIAS